MIATSYLEDVFIPSLYKKTFEDAVRILRKIDKSNPFDSIAFTGVSGAAFAFPLALKLNKSLLCVRKPGSSTHSIYELEGEWEADRYIIVDDFVETGKTLKRIKEVVTLKTSAICVGHFLYQKTKKKFTHISV